LLIDESPQLVLLSSFDPVRREIARAAWRRGEGRPDPPGQHRGVRQARQGRRPRRDDQAGEEAVARLNINGLHPEIVKMLGG